MTAGPGFGAVHTQRAGDGLLIYLEIQDDKAFAEGLPQHAYKKHYRPPFIQNTKFQAKISGKRIKRLKIISLSIDICHIYSCLISYSAFVRARTFGWSTVVCFRMISSIGKIEWDGPQYRKFANNKTGGKTDG